MIKNPTQHKAREAEFHLQQAKKHYQSDEEFAFYLSAFLSAARNITFHMQKQYGKQEFFPEWYSAERTQMEADSDLQYLKNARNSDIHEEIVHTGVTRPISTGFDAIIVTKAGEEGQEDANEAAVSQPAILRRFFKIEELGNIEVIEFCSTQLEKLSDLVARCEKEFTTPCSS